MSDKWAERYRIVKTAFWWKLIVGDCGTLYGRFYSRNEAEHMAALLLREFRNGMFVGAERVEAERDAALDRAESAEASERPLLQMRDELLAENERLTARVRELEAERDALLRDAERYRWLRDRHEYNIAASEIVQEVSGEGWDAAIDAAMGNP